MLFSDKIGEWAVMWVVMGLESSKMDKEGMMYVREEVPFSAGRLSSVI